MILDNELTFGEDVDVSQAAGTYNFTNVVDLSVARDVGNGQPLYLVLICTGGTDGIITGGSAGTITFQLVSDSTTTIATNGTQSVHLQTKDFVTDGNDANEIDNGEVIWVVPLPLEYVDEAYERYLGVQAVVATTTTTEGTVSAFLTLDPHGWKSYADANN